MRFRWYDREKDLIEVYNVNKRKPRMIFKYIPDYDDDLCARCKFRIECSKDNREIYRMCDNIASQYRGCEIGLGIDDIRDTILFEIK